LSYSKRTDMTSEDQKRPDDAVSAEFPEDRGKLVKRVHALSQLKPSAALDAAMRASHKSALLKGKTIRRAAASDPALLTKTSIHRSSFLTRLRIPMAMLMIAVLAAVMWYRSDDLLALFAQVSEPTPATAPQPVQAAANSSDTAQKAEQTDVTVKEKSLADAADKKVLTSATVAAPTTQAPVVAAKPAAPPAESRSLTTDKNMGLPVAASANAANDALHHNAERAQPEPTQTVVSQSKAKAVDKKAVTAPPPAPVAVVSEPAAQTAVTAIDKAKAWLAAIEVMSSYESRREAASAQLERFEKSYPHYPVPQALRAKLKAAKN
jgi:hypothetical protein